MARYGMTCRLAVMLLLLASGGKALARIGIDGIRDFTVPLTWSGGDIVYSTDLCVISTQEPNESQGSTPVPYQVTTTSPPTFVLSNGVNQIPFTAVWRDLAGTAVHTLAPGVPSGDIFTGRGSGCPPATVNGRVVLTIPESALLVAPPGTYSAVFMAWVESSGQGRPRIRLTINLSLTVAGVVRISQLDNIYLGTFDGMSPLSATDSLCVFRNFSGPYGVRVTGDGPGGAFMLANGASQVPITVTWNDGTGAVALTPGGLLSNRTGAYSQDPDCAGGAANNATLGVSASVVDMGAASAAGLHSGVLTVMVEIQ